VPDGRRRECQRSGRYGFGAPIILDEDAGAWLEKAWSRAPMHDAPLNREVARRSRSVRVPHQDPADRFIAATAEVHDLTLVTDDAHLLKGRGYAKLSNRQGT